MELIQLPEIDIYFMPLPEKMSRRQAEKQAKEEMLQHIFAEPVQLTYTPEGKPLLPEGYISISHSKHHLCMALSSTQEVGIDIEEIQPRLAILAPRFLSEQEITACKSKLALLARCWCAKEAIYKIVGAEAGATGKKIHIDPEHLPNTIFYAICKGQRFRLQTIIDNFLHVAVVATEIHDNTL